MCVARGPSTLLPLPKLLTVFDGVPPRMLDLRLYYIMSFSPLKKMLGNRCVYPLGTGEEIEAQKDEFTWPKSHCQWHNWLLNPDM